MFFTALTSRGTTGKSKSRRKVCLLRLTSSAHSANAEHGAGSVACGRGRRPSRSGDPDGTDGPGRANPHGWVDDRISDGHYNETRSLRLMSTLRVNSGTDGCCTLSASAENRPLPIFRRLDSPNARFCGVFRGLASPAVPLFSRRLLRCVVAQLRPQDHAMKIISVRQPWASLIASGVKDVENRT